VDALGPGAVLLGKYRVEDVIGVGGMGRVVRASHLYLQQSVAIKILLPEMAQSTSTVARFLREAQATVQLKSEHIARVIDVGTLPDGTPLMVMEYLNGNDLNQILRHHGPQSPAIVCDLMLQACEGLAEAHAAGVVHRDIKPSNFFITQRPDGSMLLKLLDFGISKTPVGVSDLTGTQAVLGTPTYMAPEQMRSGRDADARSDLWSMGVVMYQLLAGRPPFGGESYAALVLQVNGEPPAPLHVPLPAGLGEVIFRCLEKDPLNRHQNAGELARMLAPFASDPVAAALSATRTTRTLQHKAGMGTLPVAAGGGLATPMPLSPAQLTPRTWPPPPVSQATSISQGTGQVTYLTRGPRGWLIGGAAAVVLLAGAGGYIVNELTKDGGSQRAERVEAPAASPSPVETPDLPPAPPPPAVPDQQAATVPTPAPPAPAPTLPAPTLPAPTPTPTFEKPAVAEKKATDEKPAEKPAVVVKKASPPAVTERPVPRPVAKVEPRPPVTRPVTKPTKSKSDDLFDSRH
jgi:serine/threonine-protein kinase